MSRANGREGAPDIAEPLKEGGHGDHWGTVLRGTDQRELLEFIARVVRDAEQPRMFQARGAGLAACSGGEPLRACVLVENERVATAYPEAQGGTVWPITITGIVPWSNTIEGQLTGDCYGAKISFFDTRFYANRRKYRVGETYSFYINAFAYALEPAVDIEVDTELGAKVSLKGAHAYMPAGMSNEGADIDDYWFHSPLEGAISEVELAGKRLRCYSIIMAIPQDHELHVSLYAADHSLKTGMGSIVPGSDLEGFLWLQGYLQGG